MSRLGKVSASAFEAIIRPHLGAARDEVRVGPATGRDTAIVALGGGQVMAITTDPLSYIPGLGPADSAWTSLHLIVNDLVTSGLEPMYASVDLNLPSDFDDETFEAYWSALHAECERLGIAIVAGHTGRYGDGQGTVIGGGTILGIGPEDLYLEPRFARPDDRLIQGRDDRHDRASGAGLPGNGSFGVRQGVSVDRAGTAPSLSGDPRRPSGAVGGSA